MSLSLGGSKSTGGSKSAPVLFGPDKLMLDVQKRAFDVAGPSILEKAMRGGFNPREKSRLFAQLADPISAATREGMSGLREEFARSGLKGAVAGKDIGDLLGAKIGALGAARGEVEKQSRTEENRRMQRLLELMTFHAPALTGQASTSREGTKLGFGIGGGG
jgi:hypothetical protein